jgi:uncharacterized protein (DUF302 family)
VSDYTMAIALERPYDETVAAVRDALKDQGFGVLTEIDVRATLKAKLGVDVPHQVILGACRPELAHRALAATPSLGAVLPCNVVVRSDTEGRSVVEAIDPDAMARLEDSAVVHEVAAEARSRLRAALEALLTTDDLTPMEV